MQHNILGIDLGGTNMRCGVVSRAEGLVDYDKEKILNKNSKNKITNQLAGLIGRLYTPKIKGIGLGVPGIVDLNKGIVNDAFNLPGWKNVRLKEIIEQKYRVPVLLNNDANCFALGEKFFGSAKSFSNIVGIILGTGFGTGIIIGNKLYCGNNCAAGEFGRVLFKDRTIEDYCSGKFFLGKYKQRGEEIYEGAKKGNKKSLKIFEEYGENLGMAVSIVVNSIDPEIIVLGGSVSKGYRYFKNSFYECLKKNTYRHVYNRLKVRVSKVEGIGMLGAASLFY